MRKTKSNANSVGANCIRPHFKGMTQNKGITLIALIITIIVMLILVGVTINVALNGGLFTKADEATRLTQIAADKEELQIEILTSYNEKTGEVDLSTLKTNLELKGWTVTVSGDKAICTSPKGNVFEVDKEGKITERGNNSGGDNNSKNDLELLREYFITGETIFNRLEKPTTVQELVQAQPSDIQFKDVPEVIADASESIEVVSTGQDGDYYVTYIKYNGNIYVGKTSISDFICVSVESTNISLKKYILGEKETGRPITEIYDEGELIDDETTEIDETKVFDLEFMNVALSGSNSKQSIYIKCDNKAYKVIGDSTTAYTEKLELVYEPKGNEGKTTADGWIILYDNGDTVEAISPTAMGSLKLGYSEEATTNKQQVQEAADAYNNAIDIINNYCQTLEGLPTNLGVRSVGAKTDTTTTYFKESDIPGYVVGTDNWFTNFNNVAKIGDNYSEQDYIRMLYWGVDSVETEYWVASRYTFIQDETVSFNVAYIEDNGDWVMSPIKTCLWYVSNDENASSGDNAYSREPLGGCHSFAVRPIITVENI